MTLRWRKLQYTLMFILAVLLLVASDEFTQIGSASVFSSETIKVRTAVVENENFVQIIGGYGKLWSDKFYELSTVFPFPAKVKKVNVVKGDLVKGGMPILEFSEGSLNKNYDKALSSLEQIDIEMDNLKKHYPHQKKLSKQKVDYLFSDVSAKEESLDLAQQKFQVAKQLQEKDLSYKIEFLETKNDVTSAMSELAKARFDLLSAKVFHDEYDDMYNENLLALESKKSNAEFDVDQAKQWVDQQKLTIPEDGIVMDVLVSEEEYVTAGKKVAELAAVKPVIFFSRLHMENADAVVVGQEAEVVMDEYPHTHLKGSVHKIGNIVDARDRTFDVHVVLDSLQGIPFKIGMEGYLRMKIERNSNRIPSLAVINPAGKPGVFVVKGGKAEYRNIQIGTMAGGNVEVLRGLKSGEEVVIYGLEKLHDGDAVRIVGTD